MNNIECFIVRDLYKFYKDEEVEEETKLFIEEHILECQQCEKWIKEELTTVLEEETKEKQLEQQGKLKQVNHNLYKKEICEKQHIINKISDEERKVIRNVQLIMIIGIALIGFLTAWISIWLFI